MRLSASLMVITALLTSACGNAGNYGETERSICRELRRELPTYSAKDTEQSKLEGERFFAVFDAVCPDA